MTTWTTVLTWTEDNATQDHTALPEQPSLPAAVQAAETWLTERNLYASNNFGNYYRQSWDVREIDTDNYVATMVLTS